MKRKTMSSATGRGQIFTASAVAFLAAGSGTSAFSPTVSSSVKTMQRRSIPAASSISPMPSTPSRLLPTNMLRFDGEEESSSSTPSALEDQPTAMCTEIKKEKKSMNPTPVLVSMLRNTLNHGDTTIAENKKNTGLQMTSTQWMAAAAALAIAFLPLQDAGAAMSGGRMGGSFSAPPRMSRPAPVRSSSYGGRSSYSSGGYYSRPSVIVAPTVGYGSYGYAAPYYGGPGVMAVSRGPGFFDLLFWGGIFFMAASQLLSPADEGLVSSSSLMSSSVDDLSALGPGTSVVQLSVALEVQNRDDSNSILSVLDRLANTAKTDSRVGIQNLSSQVALEILRRRSSIVSATSSTKHFRNREKALREFQNRSINERSKFESETVSKFGGVDYGRPSSPSLGDGGSDRATMAVITLVLAIDGDSTKLNRINGPSDVEQALQKIAADAKVSDCLQSAEILWTPEDRSESLSVRDVIADYPELRSL